MSETFSQLTVLDYVIFGLMLCVSAAIGIYFAVVGKGQKTDGEYLMASRQMGFFPVTLSLLASLLSAISLLGIPAEIYLYGIQWYVVCVIGFVGMTAIMAHIVIPVLYPLKLTSIFEYLELRFHPIVRIMATFMYLLHNIIYIGIVMYAPALALDAVTGISWQLCVVAIGVICTVYTTVGGLKAVIWTDAFQLCVMFAGLVGIIIKSSIYFGGIGEIYQRMLDGDRMDLFEMDPSPFVRTTFWSGTFGAFLAYFYGSGISQPFAQRFFSCASERTAKIAAWSNLIGFIIMCALCSTAGACAYAFYAGCDPLTTGRAKKPDQILAFLVMELMTDISGFAGLFVSCIFCACLRFGWNRSTLSSFLNSLAAIVLRDLVYPTIKLVSPNRTSLTSKELTDENESKSSKITAASFGVIAVGMAFLASAMGDILQGALVGMVSGQIVGIWLGIGSFIVGGSVNSRAPLSTANCTANFTTFLNVSLLTTEMTKSNDASSIYQISYYLLGVTSFVVTVIVGCVVSLLTGRQDRTALRSDCVYHRVRTVPEDEKYHEDEPDP